LIIRATALALRRYPEAHQLLCGYTRVRPARIDIGLSVAGQTSYAPVMVIEGADERSLTDLVAHLATAVPATRAKEERDLAGMRRTGWIIPIGLIRRFILRMLARTFWFRRRLIGTYQITVVPDCDMVAPMVFYSGCALGVGRICDRVLAINGRPEVRTSAWLCVPIDHRAMDGRIGGTLMQTIRQILESREFLAEAGVYEDLAPSAESPEPLLAPLPAAVRKGPAATGV
jgi:pyruvate/2-oxoglutarate dehydrogenase complex dihydrolipoamide acyltransferase (E2) component